MRILLHSPFNCRRTLDSFQNAEIDALNSVDAEKRLGELTIYLPKQVHDDIASMFYTMLYMPYAMEYTHRT